MACRHHSVRYVDVAVHRCETVMPHVGSSGCRMQDGVKAVMRRKAAKLQMAELPQ